MLRHFILILITITILRFHIIVASKTTTNKQHLKQNYSCGTIRLTAQNVDNFIQIHDGEEIYETLQYTIWKMQTQTRGRFRKHLDKRVYLNVRPLNQQCFIQKCLQYYNTRIECAGFTQEIAIIHPIYKSYPHWSLRCSCQNYNPELTCWRPAKSCHKFYHDTTSISGSFENNTCAWMFAENNCTTCTDGYTIIRDGETLNRDTVATTELIVQKNCQIMTIPKNDSSNNTSTSTSLIAFEGLYTSKLNQIMDREYNWTCICNENDDDDVIMTYGNDEWGNDSMILIAENVTEISDFSEDYQDESTSGAYSLTQNVLIIIVIIIILIICFGLMIYKFKQKYAKKKMIKELELQEIKMKDSKAKAIQRFKQTYPDLFDHFDFILDDNNEEYRPCLISHELSRNSFEIDENNKLGEGRFGNVYKGKLLENKNDTDSNVDVAVKLVNAGRYYKRALLYEMVILSSIKPHPYIVDFLGACTVNMQNDELYLILGFCEHGCLETYLRNNLTRFTQLVRNGEIHIPALFDASDPLALSTLNLIQWSVQIANGMKYLGQLNIIHRDLATRNILLDAKNVVKITDFGLSRFLIENEHHYVKTTLDPLPPDLAPETKVQRQFSIKTDIWSYGLTLYEIFTLGQEPLDRMDEAVQPAHCTTSIYTKMCECWNKTATERPANFQELEDFFTSSLQMFQDDIAKVKNGNNVEAKVQKTNFGYISHQEI